MMITVLMCIFLKYLLFIIFWGNLLKFSIEIWRTYISQNELDEASQGCKIVLVNKSDFYGIYHFSFAHKT